MLDVATGVMSGIQPWTEWLHMEELRKYNHKCQACRVIIQNLGAPGWCRVLARASQPRTKHFVDFVSNQPIPGAPGEVGSQRTDTKFSLGRSPIRLSVLLKELVSYPDKAAAANLNKGFSDGFPFTTMALMHHIFLRTYRRLLSYQKLSGKKYRKNDHWIGLLVHLFHRH